MKPNSLTSLFTSGRRALAQHEAVLFYHILEYNAAAVAMFDTGMHYMLATPRWCSDYNLDEKEIIGHSHYELFPNIPEEWKLVHQRCLAGAVETKAEDSFTGNDGRIYWMSWQVRPWHTATGNVGGLIIFSEDITARKEAASAVIKSEEKYRSMVERISDGFIALDNNWEFTYVNPVAAAMFRKPAAALVGKNIWKLFPATVNGPFYKAYHEAAATQKNIHLEGFSMAIGVQVHVSIYPSLTGLSVYFRDITAQRKAEDNAAKSEEKFQSLVERISDGFVAMDNNWNFTYANAMSEKLFGKKVEEMVGKNIWEVFPNAIGGPFYRSYHRAVETQQHVQFINFSQYARKWLETNAYPSASGLTVYFRDISERVNAESAARESEETRRLIMSASLDAVVCMDTNGKISLWNIQAEKLFGWKKEEVLGMELSETIVPHKYREQHKQGVEKYKSTRKGGRLINRMVEISAMNSSGKEFPVELFIVEVNSGTNPFFCAFIRDITERKQKESELQRTNTRLSLAQSIAHIGSAEIDADSKTALWSEETCRIYGRSTSQNAVHFDDWLQYIHPDDTEHARTAMQKLFSDRQPVSFYHRIVRPGGEIRFVLTICKEEYNEKNGCMSLYAVVHDITEIKSLQQELLDQRQQEELKITAAIIDAEEKERNAIGEELHDNVNQILTGIYLQLSRVKNNPEKTGEIIETCMRYLHKAIDENRKISRELIMPGFSSTSLTQQLVDLTNYMFSASGTVIHTDIHSFDETLLNEKQKLVVYRIMQEQCTNIIKYANAKTVNIMLSAVPGNFKMEIIDNGAGMDQLEPAHGIGLRNIKSRLSTLNGYIFVVTSPGNGFKLEAGFPLQ